MGEVKHCHHRQPTAEQGDCASVRDLIRSGANVNAIGATGSTALYGAAFRDDEEMVKVLTDTADCDVDFQFQLTGHTVLSLAAQRGNLEIVRRLLETGFVNVDGEKGAIRVPIAARNGHVEVVKLLLKKGTNPNASLPEKQTALHMATERGDVAVIRLLLEDERCDPATVADEGDSPIVIATRAGGLVVVRLLLSALLPGRDREKVQIAQSINTAALHRHIDVGELLQSQGEVIVDLAASWVLDFIIREVALARHREKNNSNIHSNTRRSSMVRRPTPAPRRSRTARHSGTPWTEMIKPLSHECRVKG